MNNFRVSPKARDPFQKLLTQILTGQSCNTRIAHFAPGNLKLLQIHKPCTLINADRE
jgi:hypothetical protein